MGMTGALQEVADRWERGSGALLAASQPYGYRLSAMIKKHEHDRVALFDDPLEAALFFVLVEIIKEITPPGGEIVFDDNPLARHGFW